MFFVVSKLFWLIAQPLSLCILLMLVGMVLVALRRVRGGLGLAGVGLAVLLLSAYTNGGEMMIAPLEERFARPAAMPVRVDTIIMLGGATDGVVSTGRGVSELGEAGDRVVETFRLAQVYPKARIVLSGGSGARGGEERTEAALVARLLEALGVAPARLVLEESSRNTSENALFTRTLLESAGGPALLVTSAFHMPRAMGLFARAGVDVIAWPTDYRSAGGAGLRLDLANPVLNLNTVTTAVREWIGLLVYAATGRIAVIFPGPDS